MTVLAVAHLHQTSKKQNGGKKLMDLKKYFLTVTAGVTVTLYHIEQAKEVSEAWGRMNVAGN